MPVSKGLHYARRHSSRHPNNETRGGRVSTTPNPGRGWGPVRSVARSVARRGPRRRGSACLALRIRAVRIRHNLTIHPINETAAAQVPVAPDHAVHARRSEHGARRSRGRAPGGGAPARPGPPRRGSRTVGTVPRAWRVSRSLALPERVYTLPRLPRLASSPL